jgi:uncharacterized damage-inducible protein DinB
LPGIIFRVAISFVRRDDPIEPTVQEQSSNGATLTELCERRFEPACRPDSSHALSRLFGATGRRRIAMHAPVAALSAHFAAMARNNAWSNARLYRACLSLSDAAFAERRVSFFPSLQLTLNHILLVDRYYFDALMDGGAGLAIFADEVAYPRCADLWAAQRDMDRELIQFCDALDDTALQRDVLIDRGPDIGLQHETVGAVLPHLFIHQIHHRGQAHAMLAGTGAAPPPLDEFFLLADAPARERELATLWQGV